MTDDEFHFNLMASSEEDKAEYKLSEQCLSLPYRVKQVIFLSNRMKEVGYDKDEPITLWEGKILDGRHRYKAALEAGVEPIFKLWEGTYLEAWEYVNDHNGEDGRRMLSKANLQDFYYAWSEAVGVRGKGGANNPEGAGGWSNKASDNLDNGTNVLLTSDSPSQEEYADKLGMTSRTVKRMEADKRKIAENPEVAAKLKSGEIPFSEARKMVQVVKEIKIDLNDVVTRLFDASRMWTKDLESKYGAEDLSKEAYLKLTRNAELRSPEQMSQELIELEKFTALCEDMVEYLQEIVREESKPELKLVANK